MIGLFYSYRSYWLRLSQSDKTVFALGRSPTADLMWNEGKKNEGMFHELWREEAWRGKRARLPEIPCLRGFHIRCPQDFGIFWPLPPINISCLPLNVRKIYTDLEESLWTLSGFLIGCRRGRTRRDARKIVASAWFTRGFNLSKRGPRIFLDVGTVYPPIWYIF